MRSSGIATFKITMLKDSAFDSLFPHQTENQLQKQTDEKNSVRRNRTSRRKVNGHKNPAHTKHEVTFSK